MSEKWVVIAEGDRCLPNRKVSVYCFIDVPSDTQCGNILYSQCSSGAWAIVHHKNKTKNKTRILKTGDKKYDLSTANIKENKLASTNIVSKSNVVRIAPTANAADNHTLHIWFRLSVWHSMTTLRPSKFWAWHNRIRSLIPILVFFVHTLAYSHTLAQTTRTLAIQCMMASTWSGGAAAAAYVLQYYCSRTVSHFSCSFVAHHSLFDVIHITFCVWRALVRTHSIYRPNTNGKGDSGDDDDDDDNGGHASHRVHFDNDSWLAAMRIECDVCRLLQTLCVGIGEERTMNERQRGITQRRFSFYWNYLHSSKAIPIRINIREERERLKFIRWSPE